jgi:hypothetical protein
VRKLQITQILDERQADTGRLGLEIKASGIGLVGTLDQVLTLAPEGFAITNVHDQGVSVAKYDEGENNVIVSERNWLIDLHARQDRGSAPKTFRFGSAKGDAAEMIYQRYQDADLVAAEPEVDLEHEYRGRGKVWLWTVVSASAVLGVVVLLVVVQLLRRRPRAAAGLQLPENLTPFTVTMLLRRIQQNGNLGAADQQALTQTIADLERRYFADADANGAINLQALAEEWARKVK